MVTVHACMLSHFSCVQLFATLWTVACQAPLSMGFSRQEYWSGLPSPPPGDLPNPGIEPISPASPALAGRFFTTEPPGKPSNYIVVVLSCIRLCETPMDYSLTGSSVHGLLQAKEYWSGLPFPTPGDLPNPGIEPRSPALTGGFFTTEPPGKSHMVTWFQLYNRELLNSTSKATLCNFDYWMEEKIA